MLYENQSAASGVASATTIADLPTVTDSENKMRESAGDAIKMLTRTDNLDLLEALGLTNYVESEG